MSYLGMVDDDDDQNPFRSPSVARVDSPINSPGKKASREPQSSAIWLIRILSRDARRPSSNPTTGLSSL
jgi:hypothetical protein